MAIVSREKEVGSLAFLLRMAVDSMPPPTEVFL